MRSDVNNRWILAAMGLTIQMYQLQAYKEDHLLGILKNWSWDKLPDPELLLLIISYFNCYFVK
jgi:hypothetical protein